MKMQIVSKLINSGQSKFLARRAVDIPFSSARVHGEAGSRNVRLRTRKLRIETVLTGP